MTALTPLTYLVRIATASGTKWHPPLAPEFDLARTFLSLLRGEWAANRHHGGIAEQPTSRLLLACPDRPGLIAAVSGFLADAGLNIVDADQHSSGEGRLLHADGLRLSPGRRAPGPVPAASRMRSPARFEMDHRFEESSERKRLAIMVSREDHCLTDLLWRWRSGELGAEIVAVVSNHPDHADQVDLARPPVPPRPGRGRRQAGSGAAGAGAARRDRPARPRPLHAGPLSRVPAATSAARRSTSTTASCRPSSAPTPTSAPTSAASS